MDFLKISKSWNLAYLRVLLAQKEYNKFQNFGLSIKKVETQKCTQAAWPPFALLTCNIPCQLWDVITYERLISFCWNFQDDLFPYIYLSSGKVSSKSEMVMSSLSLLDMEWPTSNRANIRIKDIFNDTFLTHQFLADSDSASYLVVRWQWNFLDETGLFSLYKRSTIYVLWTNLEVVRVKYKHRRYFVAHYKHIKVTKFWVSEICIKDT